MPHRTYESLYHGCPKVRRLNRLQVKPLQQRHKPNPGQPEYPQRPRRNFPRPSYKRHLSSLVH